VTHTKEAKMQVPPSPQYAPDAKNMNMNMNMNAPSPYSSPVPNMSMSNPVNYNSDAKTQVNDPPPYAPPARNMGGARRRPHTNPVIEAGNIRARDEVRFLVSSA
jgi:hypothetical protein